MTQLADPAAPLVLRDGRSIDPSTGRVIEPKRAVSDQMIEVPSDVEARRLIISTRKKLSDLPAVPAAMNAVSAILSYTLFGLDDDEIALAINMPVERINRIKMSAIYEQYHQQIVDNLLSADQDNIRAVIAAHSKEAVKTLVGGLKAPKAGDRIKAADSLLDRAGHRPADVVNHRISLESNALKVVVIEKDERKGQDILDLPIQADEVF